MGKRVFKSEKMASRVSVIDIQSLHDKIVLKGKGCRGGGTGRRARLKIWWVKARAGSSPAPGTIGFLLDFSHITLDNSPLCFPIPLRLQRDNPLKLGFPNNVQSDASKFNAVIEMMVVGISCSVRPRGDDFIHELQDRYVRAIEEAGGLAVALPRLSENRVRELAEFLDGLVISGGRDIPPELYGERPHLTTDTDEAMRQRAEFEIALVKAMAELNKPVLGICYGCQLLNVAFGGTLIQDIPSQWASHLTHKLLNPPWFAQHKVEITEGSLLWNWVQESKIVVKSSHHQAVAKVGSGLKVVAWAPDGVVEAIEAVDGKPIVGVQWHPEAQLEAQHAQRLFAAFVQACKTGSIRKSK